MAFDLSALGSFLRSDDPPHAGGYEDPAPRVGFFTDTSVCIGCKACEVACKEWNAIPEDGLTFTGMSYDNSEHLGASTWRHVAFIEQQRPMGAGAAAGRRPERDRGCGGAGGPGDAGYACGGGRVDRG